MVSLNAPLLYACESDNVRLYKAFYMYGCPTGPYGLYTHKYIGYDWLICALYTILMDISIDHYMLHPSSYNKEWKVK